MLKPPKRPVSIGFAANERSRIRGGLFMNKISEGVNQSLYLHTLPLALFKIVIGHYCK
jgi:hypothetical protein